jgi:hypothetical protein
VIVVEHVVFSDTLTFREVSSVFVMGKGVNVRKIVVVLRTCALVAHGFRAHGLHAMNPLIGIKILH